MKVQQRRVEAEDDEAKTMKNKPFVRASSQAMAFQR